MNSFEFENLVLLVGTNPLQDYIVAYYFMEVNPCLKNIWLIHSERTRYQEGTGDYAANLKNLFNEKFPGRFEIITDGLQVKDVALGSSISDTITGHVIKKMKNGASVHLDYTGGTKAMSTQSFATFHDNENRLKMSYSYLDPHRHQIVVNHEDIPEGDLRSIVKISFSELIALHGFERSNDDTSSRLSMFREALDAFYLLISEKRISRFYDAKQGGYNRNVFFNRHNSILNPVEAEANFKEVYSKTPVNSEFAEIVKNMPVDRRIFDSAGNFNNRISKANLKEAVKGFLDGQWLELYVFDMLSKKFASRYEVLMDWEIRKPDWGSNKFQLDVIVMNSYQLAGVSCTISGSKTLCKSKGFEILLRTQQIGGSQAKSVLVTGMDTQGEVDLLQSELLNNTGTRASSIKVVGMESWDRTFLERQVEDFFENREG